MTRFNPAHAARALARRLAVQALYRWQLNPAAWQDVVNEFATDVDMPRADRDHFRTLVQYCCEQQSAIDAMFLPWMDRALRELDPVEHAVLMVAVAELQNHPDVPFRVVLNEAVSLTKRFGATDGHKFINGVLDRAARELRPLEH
jgi:transcription antitermination protein NusB